MKRGMRITVSLASILVIASASTNAEIIFDNGEPLIFTTEATDLRSCLQADDFILSQDAILTGGHFWTFEDYDAWWDGTLEYFIFEDNGGIPGITVISGSGKSIQKDVIFEHPIGIRYEYSFELETTVSLVADNLYWFGLHMDSGYPGSLSVFRWESIMSGFGSTSFESESGTLDNWTDTGLHRAFYLEGIPEPMTLMFFGLGGLLLIRKRST
jgi:hypothetical protein